MFGHIQGRAKGRVNPAKRPSWAIEQGRYRRGLGYTSQRRYIDVMPVRWYRTKLGIVKRWGVKRWRAR